MIVKTTNAMRKKNHQEKKVFFLFIFEPLPKAVAWKYELVEGLKIYSSQKDEIYST